MTYSISDTMLRNSMRVNLHVFPRQIMLVTDWFVDFCGATSEHEGAFNTSEKRESQTAPKQFTSTPLKNLPAYAYLHPP